ncbi:MAG TPA: methyltransferase domain-containing protein [Polaromonas sp.]|uniref:methyltransferase domain-containing protein n=1 Tax=Polaromonas sp. TaxID=1869339 RepID=UPI002D71F675|nr:methyltransferase domain-containing protein [Polaromonas sp.]HYW56933.1 methyltransferase domain-containing protein [Polaromonas sp.]
MIQRAIAVLRSRGVWGLLRVTYSRLRSLNAGRAKSFAPNKHHFAEKSGIEIGGPSAVFSARGMFPVYSLVKNLDNCNFSDATIWGESSANGGTYFFHPGKPLGRQHIGESSMLHQLLAGTYDFVLSSHMLEHTANPLLALSLWKKLLTDNGLLALVLPNKSHTFDHRRPVTTLEHLIEDFQAGMPEDDLTHLPEILALHDLKRDPDAGDIDSFKSRSMRNFENRSLHHHVFDRRLAVSVVEYVGLELCAAEEIAPHHILVLARKPPSSLL